MKKTTLIIADENENALNELKQHFTTDTYEVVATTTSGTVLIDLIKNLSPDVVLMDIVLQNCDGFKVLESMDKQSKTKVVIQSSLSIDGFINKAIGLGAKYYCLLMFKL